MILHKILYPLAWLAMHLYHPFSRVIGRENIPEEGCMICANHSALSDPVWLCLGLGIRSRKQLHIMAKKEAMEWPVLGKLFHALGAYGIDRGNADLAAIKNTLTYLKDGDSVVIFPEGTRMKPGKVVEPKTGAVMLASRSGVPILPVYITHNKRPFRPVQVIFGQPISMEGRKRLSAGELEEQTHQMMDGIYALGAAK